MIEIEIAWLIVLIVLASPTILLIVFGFIYFLAILHDLFLVRYYKPTKSEKQCPYEIEDDNNERK